MRDAFPASPAAATEAVGRRRNGAQVVGVLVGAPGASGLDVTDLRLREVRAVEAPDPVDHDVDRAVDVSSLHGN